MCLANAWRQRGAVLAGEGRARGRVACDEAGRSRDPDGRQCGAMTRMLPFPLGERGKHCEQTRNPN